VFFGQAGTSVKEGPLLSLLPDRSELKGWIEDGDHQFFEGDDLFVYIDGGAEIYFEYGFGRVIVQDYKNAAGSRLSLEIFEMNSPESAYGMFTFKSSLRGEAVDLGDECQLADYYLNLRKGRYLVTITGLDRAKEAEAGLLTIARAVDARIAQTAGKPDLLSIFPEEGLQQASVKFFLGPLGVFNSEQLLAPLAAGIERGAKGDYVSGRAIGIFQYPDKGLAEARLTEAKTKFAQDQKLADFAASGSMIKARDQKGRSILAQLEGEYIVFVIGGMSLHEARADLTRVVERIRTRPKRH
jgi:hypothetical protein